MRQAGRSLPEYREIRERHDLFEICRQPELCAEVTLQPVRRHGVDAAVLFADIMLPVLGMGIDVELVEGVGPGRRASRSRAWPTSSGCACRSREEAVPFVLETIRLVRDELGADQAVDRLRRRAVHGRRLPGRGQADARLRQDQGVHVRRARGLARAHGQARRHVRRVRPRAQVDAGADVVQLFDSWVGASRPPTTGSSSPPTRRASSRPTSARRSTSAPGRRTCSAR